MKNGLFQNRLLELALSPMINLYSKDYRVKVGKIINKERITESLIPAIIKGSRKHVESRKNAIANRFSNKISDNKNVLFTIEALSDSHFRKQRNKGISSDELSQKVLMAHYNKEPINLVGLMFTRKNISPLRRNDGDESLTDLAEVASLIHLNSFAELIDKFYPWGVHFIILSEGKRFKDVFDYTLESTTNYQNNLKEWIKTLGLKFMKLYDYDDFLNEKLTEKQSKLRRKNYDKALNKYNHIMLPILDPKNIDLSIKKAIQLDPQDDPENSDKSFIPLWKSLLISLPYHPMKSFAENSGIEYDHLYLRTIRSIFLDKRTYSSVFREHVINTSWNAAICHNSLELGDIATGIQVAQLASPFALRTTINPKHGSSLGIFTIRETTSRVQPWHGTGFLETDKNGSLKATALSKLELESKGSIPIYIDRFDGKPFCYATAEASAILQKGDIIFEASTR